MQNAFVLVAFRTRRRTPARTPLFTTHHVQKAAAIRCKWMVFCPKSELGACLGSEANAKAKISIKLHLVTQDPPSPAFDMRIRQNTVVGATLVTEFR